MHYPKIAYVLVIQGENRSLKESYFFSIAPPIGNVGYIVAQGVSFCMKYRSRTDIVSQMLEAANGCASKTKIMYMAYLSYAQLTEYLTMLVESGLIEYQQKEQGYKTTEKGLRFVETYKEIGNMVRPISNK